MFTIIKIDIMNNLKDIELPDNFNDYPDDTKQNILEYINTLNCIEIKAYHIAKCHLGTSFNILKSNGYITWLENK